VTFTRQSVFPEADNVCFLFFQFCVYGANGAHGQSHISSTMKRRNGGKTVLQAIHIAFWATLRSWRLRTRRHIDRRSAGRWHVWQAVRADHWAMSGLPQASWPNEACCSGDCIRAKFSNPDKCPDFCKASGPKPPKICPDLRMASSPIDGGPSRPSTREIFELGFGDSVHNVWWQQFDYAKIDVKTDRLAQGHWRAVLA